MRGLESHRPRSGRLLRQGTSKEVPYQSLQTENRRYPGFAQVAGKGPDGPYGTARKAKLLCVIR